MYMSVGGRTDGHRGEKVVTCFVVLLCRVKHHHAVRVVLNFCT